MDHPKSTCLVKECRSLEGEFGTDFTKRILSDVDEVSANELKKEIKKRDKKRLLEKCSVKAPLLVEINQKGGNWPAIWDAALHCGSRHTIGLQFFTRILAHHG